MMQRTDISDSQPLPNVAVGGVFSLMRVSVYSLEFGSAVENHAVLRLVKINSSSTGMASAFN